MSDIPSTMTTTIPSAVPHSRSGRSAHFTRRGSEWGTVMVITRADMRRGQMMMVFEIL